MSAANAIGLASRVLDDLPRPIANWTFLSVLGNSYAMFTVALCKLARGNVRMWAHSSLPFLHTHFVTLMTITSMTMTPGTLLSAHTCVGVLVGVMESDISLLTVFARAVAAVLSAAACG